MRSLSVSPGFFQPMQEDNSLEGYLMSLAIAAFSKIRQSKINSRWVAGPIGRMNRRPSV